MSVNNNTMYPKQWLLYWGDLINGFHFYGPFKSYDEALKWSGDQLHVGTVYRIIEMADVRNDL